MDALHNPIANMYGPEFLVFYAVVIAAAFFGCVAYIRSIEPRTAAREIPSSIDPYEIAYLRGGTNEVIRTVTIALLERGVLERRQPFGVRNLANKAMIAQADSGDPTTFSGLETAVFRYCRQPRAPYELFSFDLANQVRVLCEPYRAQLIKRGLMPDAAMVFKTRRAVALTGMAVLALGGYKFAAAWINGHHNVIFLGFELAFALALYIGFEWKRRITFAGQQYVQDVRQAFSTLQHRAASQQTSDNTVLIAAIFGVAMLAGTEQASYAAIFRQSGNGGGGCGTSTGSCGSSGGSSCSGGGSSGGCGGGGGGCGGCGGGG